MQYAVGVDIGGTNIRVALGDEDGIQQKVQERTVKTGGSYAVSQQIIRMIKQNFQDVIYKGKVKGIGIGSIGPLNLKEGAIVNTPNLPFKYIPLIKPIYEAFKIPVKLYNDCVAAVIGEKTFGEAKNVDNVVYLTLSTGIGAGVYVDGHLLLGKDGNAHEVGHMVIDYQGRLTCGCGKKGHWEAYCSGRNIPNLVKLVVKEGIVEVKGSILYEKINNGVLTSKDVFEAAKQGDIAAVKIVDYIGYLNAIGFANINNIYDPELITIGGSVALNNEELVLTPILNYIKEYSINRIPKIVITPLKEDIVLYGAIAAVLNPPL